MCTPAGMMPMAERDAGQRERVRRARIVWTVIVSATAAAAISVAITTMVLEREAPRSANVAPAAPTTGQGRGEGTLNESEETPPALAEPSPPAPPPAAPAPPEAIGAAPPAPPAPPPQIEPPRVTADAGVAQVESPPPPPPPNFAEAGAPNPTLAAGGSNPIAPPLTAGAGPFATEAPYWGASAFPSNPNAGAGRFTDPPTGFASSWTSDPNAGAGQFTTEWNTPAFGTGFSLQPEQTPEGETVWVPVARLP
jgi:hypothetical protein